MFKKAIVRTPCPALINGLTTAKLGIPDIDKALQQHQHYIQALEKCGISVTILPALSTFPDSTFVEDVAICTPHCAIITNPSAPSRQGEQARMSEILSQFYSNIECIESPGTLDGGDVMEVGNHYFIGISKRTNRVGAAQLIAILKKYGMTGTAIAFEDGLHLKTSVSFLSNNYLLITEVFKDISQFTDFQKIIVPKAETYAANSLWLNGKILVPARHPKTRKNVKAAGFEVLEVEVSEFEKIDGGVTCLSLRF